MLDPLTLDQLRVLVAVADTGSFSAAARRLQRVQSAVSQSIQTLESTLRLTLFDRTGKKPHPTEAGRVMIADARRLLDSAAALRERAASIATGLEAELTVAVDQLLPLDAIMSALRALRLEFPQLQVRLLTEGVGAPERYLRDGRAHLAVYATVVTGVTDLEREFLTDVAMVPVVSSAHPLAAMEGPLSRDVLSEHVQLVLTDVSEQTGWSVGVVSHHVWRFADMHTRLEFLLGGFGWCNMPLHLVKPHLSGGALKRLHPKERDGFSVALSVVHRRQSPPGQAGRWLIEHLREHLGKGG
ncbi:Transcriptional regulator, LysR family [Roseomonas mucosa]|uniref:HTH-type transcriptional activator AllS n=1 Tax=Roseomonas mucosa TaxID=207340 RepID=A0A379MXE3_9PROT|nr:MULTISPECIES: LysR family transcriptional regulator [Roseomonas]MBS5903300.1 LysR family transcriptional regulator [Acetobacteraceae bacterium]ATR22255.1 LysR family transcriptional regulator [Roseomonas sp. FDAARGOS_362]MCG7354099.1 LysR family transcriptional regulator [Roseomonas mucosa]MCG7356708.1 LysR family transcriptional regulator [Roseomonas mucosa]MDT8289452.1 LysR family transcriptional regulator [Roseomonas mucosa]